jgi:glucose-1-phosphate cytidylyltransferase
MLTYGDAVSDLNISKLIEFHKKHGKIGTVSSVRPTARFGELSINSKNIVEKFEEKPQTTQGWINGGFFVFESQFLDYINNDLTVLEKEPLSNLSNNRNLAAYKHDGFWQSMDNVRDLNVLKKLWNENIAPWK